MGIHAIISHHFFPYLFRSLCICVCACKCETESSGLDNDLDCEPNDFHFDTAQCNATKLWILIPHSISVYACTILSSSLFFHFHFTLNVIFMANGYLCIQLVSANIILNLSIFISKFSDHLFSNLPVGMCQESRENRMCSRASKEECCWMGRKKMFLPVADCTYGDEHRKYWSTSPLATIRFCDFILLDLLSLFFFYCCFWYFFFRWLFCLTKLRLYYVIDVLTYLPSQNRFYHDPFTPSLYSSEPLTHIRASAHIQAYIYLRLHSRSMMYVCESVSAQQAAGTIGLVKIAYYQHRH